MSTIAEHGAFLRVDEAAQVLRISRTSAYELARRWLESGGRDGLPAVRLGRSIRIPAAALDRLANPDVMPDQ
jgi:excisionase family DNA binding protein